jgi:hypothetical protein
MTTRTLGLKGSDAKQLVIPAVAKRRAGTQRHGDGWQYDEPQKDKILGFRCVY